MAKFNSLVMVKHFIGDSRISIQKSFFGLCKKYTYTPTGSCIIAIRKEYTPSDGSKIERALTANASDRVSQLAALEKMNQTTLGNYMLEMYQSEDGQFAALQLSQFKQLSYEPVTPVCVFEGKDATVVINAL